MSTRLEEEVATEKKKSRVVVLVATIPPRRRSCERLLAELGRGTRRPDGVFLVLDGHEENAMMPDCPLPILGSAKSPKLSGAGNRWRALADAYERGVLLEDDIVICLDDDIVTFEAPKLVERLAEKLEKGAGAAAAMGRRKDMRPAPPGPVSCGALLYGAGCSITSRASTFAGVPAFAAEVKASGGPDALGVLGDDDALVSAFLWKKGIEILHAATGNIYPAPGTRTSSQTAARALKRDDAERQKIAIGKITGWPWNDTNKKKGGPFVHSRR